MDSPLPNPLKPGAFFESLICFLMPFFIATALDADEARAEIIETLCSYGARTRAELANAARIIAFSLSSLDLLAQAKEADLSPSQRVRFRSCANGLNRSTMQNEKTLEERLARDPPAPTNSSQEPINDLTEADAQALLESANAAIQSYRDRASGTRPTQVPPGEAPTQPLPIAAMAATLQQTPANPASHGTLR